MAWAVTTLAGEACSLLVARADAGRLGQMENLRPRRATAKKPERMYAATAKHSLVMLGHASTATKEGLALAMTDRAPAWVDWISELISPFPLPAQALTVVMGRTPRSRTWQAKLGHMQTKLGHIQVTLGGSRASLGRHQAKLKVYPRSTGRLFEGWARAGGSRCRATSGCSWASGSWLASPGCSWGRLD